jgi:Asp-tRNA(Asn)/Glu-tRNA(Gln) amidotransferase A subunit family amidase
MFVGRKYSERILIRLAYAFEQATMTQQEGCPIIKPTADLTMVA